MPNGYYIKSELDDVLQNGYYKSPLRYINIERFVNEVSKLKSKMNFYLKNTKKDIMKTEVDDEDYRNSITCRFREKSIESDKVTDHCHLTCKYRGPAHNKCNINVTQDQSIFKPFVLHNFSNYDCRLFFKKLVDKKNAKVKLKIIPNTNEEYISVRYGCIRFISS